MTTTPTEIGLTVSFTHKSEMRKAFRYLRNCSILSRTDTHRGDNRLHILVPSRSTPAQVADGLAKAGFQFAIRDWG